MYHDKASHACSLVHILPKNASATSHHTRISRPAAIFNECSCLDGVGQLCWDKYPSWLVWGTFGNMLAIANHLHPTVAVISLLRNGVARRSRSMPYCHRAPCRTQWSLGGLLCPSAPCVAEVRKILPSASWTIGVHRQRAAEIEFGTYINLRYTRLHVVSHGLICADMAVGRAGCA